MPRKRETLPENYNADFPKRLRELLAENGKSQKELAEAMGKTRQAIGYYADGSSSPDWEALKFIANYFEVSADYLLGLSDVRSPEVNMQIVCNYTGLSEDAILVLRDAFTSIHHYCALSDLIESDDYLNYYLCRVREETIALDKLCEDLKANFPTIEQLKCNAMKFADPIITARERLEVALYRLSDALTFDVNELYSSRNALYEATELIDEIFISVSDPAPISTGDTPDGEHKED